MNFLFKGFQDAHYSSQQLMAVQVNGLNVFKLLKRGTNLTTNNSLTLSVYHGVKKLTFLLKIFAAKNKSSEP